MSSRLLDLPVHQAFEACARRTPERSAIESAGAPRTYADVNAATNRLARRLRRCGAGAGAFVAVAMQRRPELVTAMLAVLKAGAAYVPLDPAYPEDRLLRILDDARPVALVADETVPSSIVARFGGTVIRASDVSALDDDAQDLGLACDLSSAAYVLYTSGSTGRPKGVVVPHGALANHMAWILGEFGIGADDRVLQKTSISFDASVWELYAPLMVGGVLALAPPDAHRDPAALVRAVVEARATILQVVPTMLAAMLDVPELDACRSLRLLFAGGEALPTRSARAMTSRLGVRVVNLYGPTEACIDTLWFDAAGAAPDAIIVPIGRPIPGVRAAVLDDALQPVAANVAGELFLAGVALARGYVGSASATAERFLPSALGGPAGERMYKTGDLARTLPNGVVEYLGRADDQVKVRGYRIELGDVEAALEAAPNVASAAAAVREDTRGEKHVVGYVVGRDGSSVDVDGVRQAVKRALPEYMVPSQLVVLGALPLTPNGKLDRRSLPTPEFAATDDGFVAPEGDVEREVAAAFAAALQLERVGALDDFFDLGGHSLLAPPLLTRLGERFGVYVSQRTLFESSTPRALAEAIEAMLDPS